MTPRENPELEELVAGALAWWRDAGVDCAFVDEPTRWDRTDDPKPRADRKIEAAPMERTGATPTPSEPAPRLDRSALPASLDVFSRWWMEEPSLVEGPLTARVPPRGPQGADLMIVVPEPERDDGDTLLGGPQGRLLDAMLSAFGIRKDRAYFASALPRHLPGADWDDLAARGLGDVLAHHIALAAPKRLAVFGATVLPLIGNGPPQGPAALRIFNHEGMKVELLACRSLAALLEQPRWKARIWQAWLDLMSGS